jgi:hypothetical protein
VTSNAERTRRIGAEGRLQKINNNGAISGFQFFIDELSFQMGPNEGAASRTLDGGSISLFRKQKRKRQILIEIRFYLSSPEIWNFKCEGPKIIFILLVS